MTNLTIVAIMTGACALALLIWVMALGDYPWRWLRRPKRIEAKREWVVIQAEGITVAQGYRCETCGVIGCNSFHHRPWTAPAAKGLSPREERARIIATSERPREFL